MQTGLAHGGEATGRDQHFFNFKISQNKEHSLNMYEHVAIFLQVLDALRNRDETTMAQLQSRGRWILRDLLHGGLLRWNSWGEVPRLEMTMIWVLN